MMNIPYRKKAIGYPSDTGGAEHENHGGKACGCSYLLTQKPNPKRL